MGHRRQLVNVDLFIAHDHHAAATGPLLLLLLVLQGLLVPRDLLLGEYPVDPDVPENPPQAYLESRRVADDGQEELNQK